MREEMLRQFFMNKATASELAKDVAGSVKRLGPISSAVAIEDMDEEFTVTRPMLVSLCDAALSGALPPEALKTIGFALEASDKFIWDGDEGDVLANVIADWSCPEINYPLTEENIRRFKAWLNAEEPYPARPTETSWGEVISVVEKKPLKRRWWKR